MTAPESLPSDLTAAHAMILAERAERLKAEAVAARARATNSSTDALIAHLKLEIEKLQRELYGSRSERKARLLEQMELQLEDLEATATEDELAAEKAAAETPMVLSFERKRPSRKPFLDHLPRERVVIPAPESCHCCGSRKLSKLGEDITETLEVISRQWKVIETVREMFSCRDFEKITQPPAPFHVTPHGFAGPNLLAMILFEKFGKHQPLNRQCERHRREGIELSVSTLADQVGPCTVALKPLHALIESHVLAAERLHGDDTTVPTLARGKTVTGQEACAQHGVAVEINANPHRLDLDWRWHRRALELGCIFSINRDAHSIDELDPTSWGVLMARKGGIPPDRVLNCRDHDQLERYLTKRARRR